MKYYNISYMFMVIILMMFKGTSYCQEFDKEKTDSLFIVALNEYRDHHGLNKVKRDKNIDSSAYYHGTYIYKRGKGTHFEDKDVPGHEEINTPNERLRKFSEYKYGREIAFNIKQTVIPAEPIWNSTKHLKKFIKKYFKEELKDLNLNEIGSYLSLYTWHNSKPHRKAMLSPEVNLCGIDIRIYNLSKDGGVLVSKGNRFYKFTIVSVAQFVEENK